MKNQQISDHNGSLDFRKIHREGWVDRYILGQLDEHQQRAFEEFMLDDTDIQDEVHTALSMRTGLRHAGRKSLEAEFNDPGAGWLSRLLPGRSAPVAAAAFATVAMVSLALLVSSNYQISQLRSELHNFQAPQALVSSVTLPQVRSGTDAEFEPLGVLQSQANGGWLVLNLELSFPERKAYDVEIISWPDQQSILTVNRVKPDPFDNLVFALHASELPVGDYLARVVYDEAQQNKLVASYAFSVAGSDQ